MEVEAGGIGLAHCKGAARREIEKHIGDRDQQRDGRKRLSGRCWCSVLHMPQFEPSQRAIRYSHVCVRKGYDMKQAAYSGIYVHC